MPQKSTIIYSAIILILFSAIIFLGLGWINTSIELKNKNQLAKAQNVNFKVVDFLALFVDKVLKNDKEIIFEERLQLENAVLDLKDQQILDQWHKFTKSETENEAQKVTIELIELLIKKIR